MHAKRLHSNGSFHGGRHFSPSHANLKNHAELQNAFDAAPVTTSGGSGGLTISMMRQHHKMPNAVPTAFTYQFGAGGKVNNNNNGPAPPAAASAPAPAPIEPPQQAMPPRMAQGEPIGEPLIPHQQASMPPQQQAAQHQMHPSVCPPMHQQMQMSQPQQLSPQAYQLCSVPLTVAPAIGGPPPTVHHPSQPMAPPQPPQQPQNNMLTASAAAAAAYTASVAMQQRNVSSAPSWASAVRAAMPHHSLPAAHDIQDGGPCGGAQAQALSQQQALPAAAAAAAGAAAAAAAGCGAGASGAAAAGRAPPPPCNAQQANSGGGGSGEGGPAGDEVGRRVALRDRRVKQGRSIMRPTETTE